jgi:lipopolysaccharide biosynthesis glycosyltransferase
MIPSLTLAFASDENYLDGLVGTLSGVARSAPGATIRAYVLDCGIQDAGWREMEQTLRTRFSGLELVRHVIEPNQLSAFNPQNQNNRLNNSAYARLLLPELLPDTERIIYLDCDLMVDADLRPLFITQLEGALIGAVADGHLPLLVQNVLPELIPPAEKDSLAFNSGVLLMDLAAMRRAGLIAEIRSAPPFLSQKMQDQASLNLALMSRWKKLPTRWNHQRFVTEHFSIYRDYSDTVWHFIGKMKPWHFEPHHARGLMAEFQRDIITTGWKPRQKGTWRTLSPAWRDFLKASHAFACRHGFYSRSRSA